MKVPKGWRKATRGVIRKGDEFLSQVMRGAHFPYGPSYWRRSVKAQSEMGYFVVRRK